MSEFEVEIIRKPKNFSDAHRSIEKDLEEYIASGIPNTEARLFILMSIKEAKDFLKEATKVDVKRDAAWYFLTEAARITGSLKGSRNKTHEQTSEEGRRNIARENGKRGLEVRGANRAGELDDILKKLLALPVPKGGWTRSSLRSKFNDITAKIDNFKAANAKFNELCRHDDIKRMLPEKKAK
ncbi:hypothetical protein [Stenotrophomonas pigmentata]|uniref:hypothetical protein n=1 Tax=Stenotrophomonas pigmentata TaxID=3055080 RepID=UPI0026F114F2|nr:hypothetical protein [Stenotrophomonas sp. 610A2]